MPTDPVALGRRAHEELHTLDGPGVPRDGLAVDVSGLDLEDVPTVLFRRRAEVEHLPTQPGFEPAGLEAVAMPAPVAVPEHVVPRRTEIVHVDPPMSAAAPVVSGSTVRVALADVIGAEQARRWTAGARGFTAPIPPSLDDSWSGDSHDVPLMHGPQPPAPEPLVHATPVFADGSEFPAPLDPPGVLEDPGHVFGGPEPVAIPPALRDTISLQPSEDREPAPCAELELPVFAPEPVVSDLSLQLPLPPGGFESAPPLLELSIPVASGREDPETPTQASVESPTKIRQEVEPPTRVRQDVEVPTKLSIEAPTHARLDLREQRRRRVEEILSAGKRRVEDAAAAAEASTATKSSKTGPHAASKPSSGSRRHKRPVAGDRDGPLDQNAEVKALYEAAMRELDQSL